jgi:hypothetical protein
VGGGFHSSQDPPLALLVHFANYDGRALVESPRKLVPIFGSRREWTRGTATCARTQFPLVLAYAITIHKSQSSSLDQAVLSLVDKRDFAASLTYVAISRVRTLDSLLFNKPFNFDRLQPDMSAMWKMREEDQRERQGQQVTLKTMYQHFSPPGAIQLPIRSSSPVGPVSSQHGEPSSEAFSSEFTLGDLLAQFKRKIQWSIRLKIRLRL